MSSRFVIFTSLMYLGSLLICIDNSRIIADGIRGAELVIVPDANHSVHIEKPEVVLQRITDYLKD